MSSMKNQNGCHRSTKNMFSKKKRLFGRVQWRWTSWEVQIWYRWYPLFRGVDWKWTYEWFTKKLCNFSTAENFTNTEISSHRENAVVQWRRHGCLAAHCFYGNYCNSKMSLFSTNLCSVYLISTKSSGNSQKPRRVFQNRWVSWNCWGHRWHTCTNYRSFSIRKRVCQQTALTHRSSLIHSTR